MFMCEFPSYLVYSTCTHLCRNDLENRQWENFRLDTRWEPELQLFFTDFDKNIPFLYKRSDEKAGSREALFTIRDCLKSLVGKSELHSLTINSFVNWSIVSTVNLFQRLLVNPLILNCISTHTEQASLKNLLWDQSKQYYSWVIKQWSNRKMLRIALTTDKILFVKTKIEIIFYFYFQVFLVLIHVGTKHKLFFSVFLVSQRTREMR